jgi:hypothetical protein
VTLIYVRGVGNYVRKAECSYLHICDAHSNASMMSSYQRMSLKGMCQRPYTTETSSGSYLARLETRSAELSQKRYPLILRERTHEM